MDYYLLRDGPPWDVGSKFGSRLTAPSTRPQLAKDPIYRQSSLISEPVTQVDVSLCVYPTSSAAVACSLRSPLEGEHSHFTRAS
jgi:hypothetical protein